jgi:hypothetical protein
MTSNKNKKTKKQKMSLHPQLDSFEIKINQFGEVVATYDLNRLNQFLDTQVEDKKFRGIEVVKKTFTQ